MTFLAPTLRVPYGSLFLLPPNLPLSLIKGGGYNKMNMNKVSPSLSIRPSYGGGGRGEGEKRKEGLTQNHSANRVTHPKSGCSSDWITHNTP